LLSFFLELTKIYFHFITNCIVIIVLLKFNMFGFNFRSDDMLRYELESRGDMDGTDDSSNYHYCKIKFEYCYI